MVYCITHLDKCYYYYFCYMVDSHRITGGVLLQIDEQVDKWLGS